MSARGQTLRLRGLTWLSAVLLVVSSNVAWAHATLSPSTSAGAPQELAGAEATGPQLTSPSSAFPAEIGGPFTLTDQSGRRVSDSDFRGRYMMIFFGYSRCDSICPVGLRNMTAALDLIGEGAAKVQPMLITVDPGFDTPAALAETVPEIHPRLIGLTGSAEELTEVREAYQVAASLAFTDVSGRPVYAHGSFIYLVGPSGDVLSVLPPTLSAERIAGIVRKYLADTGS